jgi:D-sedoheptulose 7-phosphate isomerase
MNAVDHVRQLADALGRLERDAERIEALGERIGASLAAGARLLAVGNGGSAAQAQHLTAELVGRFDGERRPLAALAIGAEHATTTAIVNDYGTDDAFGRPVHAHGRPGDVLVALSTSGRSPNVLAAVAAAHEDGLLTVGLTGPRPNPLAGACCHAITVDAGSTATVQEVHQVVIHLLCRGIDRAVRGFDAAMSDEHIR